MSTPPQHIPSQVGAHESCATSDDDIVDDLMYLLSSDGWETDSWDDVVKKLPKGYVLTDDVPNDSEAYLREHFLTQKYENGECKFEMLFVGGYWHINRICPCGLRDCEKHIIPSEMRFEGKRHHDGVNIAAKFRKLPVCTRDEAFVFWRKYPGHVTISGNNVTRRLYREWAKICKFPKGHELFGSVLEGEEMSTLQARFGVKFKNGRPKYKIEQGDVYEVTQQCPCGKKCNIHVLPSEVELKHSFKLVMYRRKTRTTPRKVDPIAPLFRRNHAMTLQEAHAFFEQFPLKWKVEVTSEQILFKMICKCGEAFESTPCNVCTAKQYKPCHLCGSSRRRRMLKKCHPSKNCKKCPGICSDCKAVEISLCPHCNLEVPLNHQCTPLVDQHFSFKKHPTYPAFVRTKHSNIGYCPDCKREMNEKIYHRHSYRMHNDLQPCNTYDRDYQEIDCLYCDYFHYDITNVNEHMKMHSTELQHPCKLGCGARFSRAAGEMAHRKKVHKQNMKVSTKRVRRVGRKIVYVSKRKKIEFIE